MNNEPEHRSDGSPGMTEEAMPQFERELAGALRPLRLPVGLADRIVAAADIQGVRTGQRRGGLIPFPVRRWLGGAAIAAALVGGIFATQDVRQNRARERQHELATQRFETATRITDGVLAHTREHLQRVGALQPEELR